MTNMGFYWTRRQVWPLAQLGALVISATAKKLTAELEQ